MVVSSARHLPAQVGPETGTPKSPRTFVNYGALPLTFEANQGQTNPEVRYLSRGNGYTAFLTAGGLVLSLRPTDNPRRSPSTILQFRLVGAEQNPTAVGEDPQAGRVNYFVGNDPRKWQRNVPTYARIRYKNVYPGIDLLYYGSHRQLEYDFAISPGADPNLIQFEVSGATQIQGDAKGDLVLQTGNGELHFQSPAVYQESKGLRVQVRGGYVISDPTHFGFHVAPYDTSKPLVIDPALVYSTYLGGNGVDQCTGVAVDGTGSIYIAGYTNSADFLLTTIGAPSTNANHVFVAKLDPTGSSLVYADYIGGNSEDYGIGLTLDSTNNVYVTGSTMSSNFPMVNAYQAVEPGSYSGFLSKVSADGSSLLYSTYLGGSGFDQPAGIAVDTLSEAYVVGTTSSQNFPVVNAYQNAALANQAGLYGSYGFVSKFSADGSSLIYSTYLAGNSNVVQDCGSPCWPAPYSAVAAVALDANDNAYVAGTTNTYNFPATSGAYLTSNSTQQDATIGFVSKLGSSGGLDYSTYFYGSSGNSVGIGAIAVDGSGSAYIDGTAISDGTFPITSTGICDPGVYGFGCSYAFVTKFDPVASTLLYSTFLGPNNYASPVSIALDLNDNAYVLANITSDRFGTNNGIEGYTSGMDMLLVEIDASATTELFATYMGGSGNDFASGIALDANGSMYVAGSTYSADFPVTQGALQDLFGGQADAFVLKIGPSSAPAVSATPSLLQFTLQAVGSISPAQTVLLRNMGSSPLLISSITISHNFAETDNCGSSVPAAGDCTFSVNFAPIAPGSLSGSIVILDDAAGSPHVINLSGDALGPVASLAPTSLIFPSQQVGTTSAAQTVTLTNTGNTVLNVSGVQVTGDFAQTNNCSAPLPASSRCTLNIMFSPTASGTRGGTLTVTNNTANSPQTEILTGSGSDFSLASSPGSDTVKAGSAANYSLTVAPVGGSFADAVKLTCSGLPAETSCSLSPNAVTPGWSTATSTLSITTTATVAQTTPNRTSRRALTYAIWIQLSVIGLVGMMLAASKHGSKKTRALVLLSAALVFMIGCGGTGIVPTPQAGTPPGTYSITVRGTSGGLQHSMPVTLIVQ